MPKDRITCECDYDFDDGRYVKTSRFCPLHDSCSCCMERPGTVRRGARGAEWLCAECAAICDHCGENGPLEAISKYEMLCAKCLAEGPTHFTAAHVPDITPAHQER